MGMQLVYLDEPRTGAIEELSCVSLKRAMEVEDAQVLPAGSTGTVVGVLKEGVAYIVEFTKPFPALVDVEIEDLEIAQAERDSDGMAGPVAHRAT